MSSDIATRRKRLLYQAQHRGFKEADLLIGGFASAHLSSMDAAEIDEFELLLGHSDHDLYAWLKGGALAPESVKGPIFRRLQAFKISTYPRG